MRKRVSELSFSLILIIVLLPRPASAGVNIPGWLRDVAQQPAKHYPDDANAAVLLDDEEVTVRDNGEIVTRQRLVYRILRPEGRSYATLPVYYDNETKLNSLHGWSITSTGQEYEAKEKDAFERSAFDGEIYSDDKMKILEVPGGDVGTIVGFEYEQKNRPYLFQDTWIFQERIPVDKARYTLHLPPAWEYRSDWINHPELKPTEQGGTAIWELTDIPRIESEVNRPPQRALEGRMLLTFYSEAAKNQSYSSWNDMALWWSQLAAGSRDSSPEMQEKVQQLAPASMPLFDRVRALAEFAQHDVRYAAIEIGIGGFRPHSASEVFKYKYGDCKDKANLLSAMLAQIGVKSYYMPVNDERGILTRNTPPLQNFNHMILAIQLPDGSYPKDLPALYEHPKLGHLLIFDPTNEYVPFGQIPSYEQDSYALLVSKSGGDYIHLPVSKPDANGVRRTAKLQLLPDGTLQGEVDEVRTGHQAELYRAYLKDESQSGRRKVLEHFLGQMMGSFQVNSFDVENAADINKDLVVRYKFTAQNYAKNAGGMLLLRPRVVGEWAGYYDVSKPRHYPYEIDAPFMDTDTVEIALPDGFKVDELPDPAKISVPFGEYASKTETEGNVLKYTREYKVDTTLVPLDQMMQLRNLFGRINADEKNMAILKRAN